MFSRCLFPFPDEVMNVCRLCELSECNEGYKEFCFCFLISHNTVAQEHSACGEVQQACTDWVVRFSLHACSHSLFHSPPIPPQVLRNATSTVQIGFHKTNETIIFVHNMPSL